LSSESYSSEEENSDLQNDGDDGREEQEIFVKGENGQFVALKSSVFRQQH